MNLMDLIINYRLVIERNALDEAIKEKQGNVKENVNKWNIFQKGANKLNQTLADKKSNKLEELDNIFAKYNYDSTLTSTVLLEQIKDNINLEYNNDDLYLKRLLLGVAIVLDDTFKYQETELEYKELSNVIFNSENKLSDILTKIENNLLFLNGRTLSEINLNDLKLNAELYLKYFNTIINGRGVDVDFVLANFKKITGLDFSLFVAILLLVVSEVKSKLSADEFKVNFKILITDINNLNTIVLDELLIKENDNDNLRMVFDLIHKFEKKLFKIFK